MNLPRKFPGVAASAVAEPASAPLYPQPESSVKLLLISPVPADGRLLRDILHTTNWDVRTVRGYREGMSALCAERMGVIVCDAKLPDGNWRDVLGQTLVLPEPPHLIVACLHADEQLWSEVLNMGGFDVLLKPFDEQETRRVIGLAWCNWQRQWAPPIRMARTSAAGAA